MPIMGAVLDGFVIIGIALPVLPLYVHSGLGFDTFVLLRLGESLRHAAAPEFAQLRCHFLISAAAAGCAVRTCAASGS
ncbi:hypothetical protein DWV00_17240 [Trinickia dinghuensis]|uniref:Uncharacterized protein n=1 Tax=Trinickia dinghuensis TaxID=2291023 RepID=A0A3D8JXT4_9BURK|nr:hypothetical protein DWV00_17240 [Trinickia dinghuensis]